MERPETRPPMVGDDGLADARPRNGGCRIGSEVKACVHRATLRSGCGRGWVNGWIMWFG